MFSDEYSMMNEVVLDFAIDYLTYLPWAKCPPFRRRHFPMNFLEWKFRISIQISLKFVPKGPTDNKSALVQVMAWSRTGDKPLPEPMRTRFTDAYMRH